VPSIQVFTNYPNPFRYRTTIRFSLKSEEQVNISILDSRGKLVTVLHNTGAKAGMHSVQWDGKNSSGVNMNAGLYYYRMKAGEFEKTKKMMLLK
jgi:flagellar hook assembly protein FlgD